MRKHAFTLIELLVVIAIISILSAVVVTNLSNVRTDAKITLANAQMQEIAKFIEVARLTQGKTLYEITGDGNSSGHGGGCRDGSTGPLNILASDHACITRMLASFQKVADAIPDQTVMNYFRDPWGSPYLWDENEGEGGPTVCGQDAIVSAGPDAVLGGGSTDDITILVPLFTIYCRTL